MSATHPHAHAHDLPPTSSWEQLAPGKRKGPKSGPGKMATVQRRYAQSLRGVYAAINAEMRRAIVERDYFGLRSGAGEQLADPGFDPDDLTPSMFDAGDPAENHRDFMDWLRGQQRRGILETYTRENNTYIRQASNRGVKFAEKELRKAGVDVDPEDVASMFNRGADANQLRLLFQRNYDQLEDVTTEVASNISRDLTERFAQGKNPNAIARTISDHTGKAKTRTTRIARYEVMNAHNTFAMRRFDRAGVEKVDIIGSDPCEEICQPIVSGGPYSLSEARGLVPAHPNCVGCPVPRVETTT